MTWLFIILQSLMYLKTKNFSGYVRNLKILIFSFVLISSVSLIPMSVFGQASNEITDNTITGISFFDQVSLNYEKSLWGVGKNLKDVGVYTGEHLKDAGSHTGEKISKTTINLKYARKNNEDDTQHQIKDWYELVIVGVLSESEFEKKKAELLKESDKS